MAETARSIRSKWSDKCRRGFDLRFQKDDEEEFMRELEPETVRAVFFASIGISIALLGFFVTRTRKELMDKEMPYKFDFRDPRTTLVIVTMAPMVWHVIIAVFAGFQMRAHKKDYTVKKRPCNFVVWEGVALVFFLMDSFIQTFFNVPAIASYYDVDPHEAFVHVPESAKVNTLLINAFLVGCMCSFCAIRWHKLWIAPVIIMASMVIAEFTAGFIGGEYWPVAATMLVFWCQMSVTQKKEKSQRDTWLLIRDLQQQEAELERRHGIGMQLLSSFCDCVLVLDSELRLAESCPKLAALLLKAPSAFLTGSSFAEVMHPEELERFQEHIEKSGHFQGEGAIQMANSMTAALTDSMGAAVNVHLYFAAMNEADGTRLMVGIVEDSHETFDSQHETSFSKHQEGTVSTSIGHRSVSEAGDSAADDVLSLGGQDMDLLEVVSTASSKRWSEVDAPKAQVLTVHMRMSQEMEITRVSDAFRDTFGLKVGHHGSSETEEYSLRDFILEEDLVQKWLLKTDYTIKHGAHELPTVFEYGIVHPCHISSEGSAKEITPMWMAITGPAGMEHQSSDDIRRQIQAGYDVIVRFSPPTSRRAKKALSESSKPTTKAKDEDSLPSFDGLLPPGWLNDGCSETGGL